MGREDLGGASADEDAIEFGDCMWGIGGGGDAARRAADEWWVDDEEVEDEDECGD